MTDSREKRTPGWVPDLSTFGARLALLRQHMGWGNVAEAARACAIPVETWRTWERDGMVPRTYMSACMKIAGVTQVDLNWLAVGPQPATADVNVVSTHGYSTLGPRVVTKGMTDRPRRTRPLARPRPSELDRAATLRVA